ncbi:MAG: 5-formyltetrahydrofolate cyclo-ligase [Alphaproteobacteria bacterium]|nr:5-formyltetrahydrofolate cyclo-ligase [Alphaproteobacteria bacterium]
MNKSNGKQALRNSALAARERLAEAAGPRASLTIARRLLGDFVFMKGAIIAGYAAVQSEADPFPIMATLAKQGHALCLPQTRGKDLIFRAWKPGDPLVVGRMNVPEPNDKARERRPDLLLVPLLAFDKAGYRLGYGAGYYDRYLHEARAKRTIYAIGIAYAGQEVDDVPHDETDELLDAVVTENGVTRFRRDAS